MTGCDADYTTRVNTEALDIYGNIPPSYLHPFTSEKMDLAPSLNAVSLDLAAICGQVIAQDFEVHVELQDTQKNVDRALSPSRVLITPEFYGMLAQTASEPEKPKEIDGTLLKSAAINHNYFEVYQLGSLKE